MHLFRIASMLLMVLTLTAFAAHAGDDKKDKKDKEGKKVELKGTVKTGIFAIGGETTGVVLETKDGNYELAVPKELKKDVEALENKQAVVTGTLVEKKGVEVRKRRIVTVTGIKAAGKK